jgi:uncharacterized protein
VTVLIVIVAVIAALALIYFVLCYFISGTLIHLNRQPVPKNPHDYGLDHENIEFKTDDGVTIRGWLIPGALNKIIVMTHVGGLTKYGSTVTYRNISKLYNKEIEFIRTAIHLHKEGYGVLMFDFRNHGESGVDPHHGLASVGLKEYQDVLAALAYIKGRDELKNASIGFISFCMGANSTIIAMSKRPAAFDNVKCLFAVQPISFEVFIRTYLKRLITRPGAQVLLPMIKKFIVWRGGNPLGKMSPGEYVKDIRVPTMYVQARNDPWTELRDIQGFYQRTPDNPKEFFWIENTKHRFESYSFFQDHPVKMLEWIKRWV